MSNLLNLAWLIPLFPFLAFVAIPLFTYRNRKLSHALVIGGIAAAFLISQVVFWVAVTLPEGTLPFQSATIHWLVAGKELFQLGVYIDPASTVMIFMVPLVCMMIFIYSVGYMNFGTDEVDPRYSRFFGYMALFATGMLGMIVFDNLLAFFIFWEIMGTCSYLLIGFWYEKKSAMLAGLKAFIVTKIGDLFFMLGLVVLYTAVGSLAYRDIFKPETLQLLAHTGFMGTQFPLVAVIALLLFGGTVGKSAQFPLHVWLPDAMEGPTPVSALIHAATMVSAGVFLVVRTFPLFTAIDGGVQMTVVAAIGAFTAIFSSIIAIAQNDIKRVLAFSTMSQLGYMVAALGIGAYVAGAFHLITHAFFKALLFLGSGSVIHAMEHGHHHAHEHGEHADEPFDPNDMRNMGGLAKRLPVTFWTFLIGGLALSGIPPLAGFWSKDEILSQAWQRNQWVFWILAVAAGITAFYTTRQILMTFFGQPRTASAVHAPESVRSMTIPLVILAVFAITLGFAGIPEDLPVIGGIVPNWFHHFVGATIESGHAEHATRAAGHLAEAVSEFDGNPMLLGFAFVGAGLLLGWLIYGLKPLESGEMDRLEAAMRKVWLGWLYDAMQNRFYFDELYQATFVQGAIWLAGAFYSFDHGVIDGLVDLVGRLGRSLSEAGNLFDFKIVDGAVNGVGSVVKLGGRMIRPVQTGRVQNYLLVASLTVLVLVAAFVFLPW